ncbi:cell division cycle 20.5, cofactor of APC complex-like [Argonauta hians]
MANRFTYEHSTLCSPTVLERSVRVFSFDRFIPFRPNLNLDQSYMKLLAKNCQSSTRKQRRHSTPCLGNGDAENYQAYLDAALEYHDENILPLTTKSGSKSRNSYAATPPWQIGVEDAFFPSPKQRKRKLVTCPSRVLDMPGLKDNIYTNIIDWSCDNYIAVCLRQTVYMWCAEKGSCRRIRVNFNEYDNAFLTALAWNEKGNSLAFGTNGGEVLLLDAEKTTLLISFRCSEKSHISSLAWNDDSFCSGSTRGNICLHDERQPTEYMCLIGRHKSVLNLKFSPSSNYLASSGDDGIVNIWDIRMVAKVCSIQAHRVTRAIAWYPLRSNVLATGGYESDGSIKLWHAPTGKLLEETYVGSSVCSMLWSTEYKELATGLSGKNFPNHIALWKFRNFDDCELVGTLRQHEGKPLHLSLSPSGISLASAGTDRILCLWDSFPTQCKEPKEDIFSPLSSLRTLR